VAVSFVASLGWLGVVGGFVGLGVRVVDPRVWTYGSTLSPWRCSAFVP
jgi:hypothetical protein